MKIIRTIRKESDFVFPANMSRDVRFAVAHCTSAPQNQSTKEMFNYWKNYNGWKTPGYHYDILPNGDIEQYVELDQIANGVKGHNQASIHFCYKGGVDRSGNPLDNRTEAQKQSQLLIISYLKKKFPNIIVLGHRDFSTDKNGNGILESWEWIKSCPSFDVRQWLSQVGMDKAVEPVRIVYKVNNPLIKNDTVCAIQTALKLKVDGWYGADTAGAVLKFQKSKGLGMDGVVGEVTARYLEELVPISSPFKGLCSQIKNK